MHKKTAIITGASSGIGYASAKKFAESGTKVLAVGRKRAGLDHLIEDSAGFAGEVIPIEADLGQSTEIDRLVEEVTNRFQRIDVLVNAAGIISNGTIYDTSLESWDEMMGINLRSVFYLTRSCVPLFPESGGSIVNVSSVAGPRSFPNVLSYCVSKAGVDQLTRCAALELASKKIRVNAVNPGVVVTNLHRRGGMDDEAYRQFLEHSENTHPLGRPGEAEEVADLIFFLASEKASWITGATYEIDGGRAQTCAR